MTYSRIVSSFALILGCGIITCALSEPQSVTLDSLTGVAEVQRAGKSDWQVARRGSALFNNDIMRVLEKSNACLKWENGSTMYLHPSSQILINLFGDSASAVISKHVTVFMGAVYFIVKEILPRGTFGRNDTKVYTPTATLAIRGTSFSVTVDKNNGTTDIQVLNGTVLVGNIIRKESMFLSAGYKTTVALSADPLVPQAIVTNNLDSLKLWVPPAIIDEEMKTQIQKAKRDYYIITGNLEDKLLIMPFTNSSNYKGPWDISGRMADFLAGRITQSSKGLTALAATQSAEDAVMAGKEQKARFVITGDIQSFEIVQLAEITAQADKYKESCVARVRFHIQLIDVASKKMVYETDISGEVSDKIMRAHTWQEISTLPFNLDDKKFSTTILAQSISQALDQAYGQIANYLK
jgi:hypothetical protein